MTLVTFRDYDREVDLMIEDEGAMGVDPSTVKAELAFRWLQRPTGFWRRLRWAVSLAWDDSACP